MTAFLITDSLMGGYFIPAGSIVSSAEARVGRPLTPGSVAGVARRTTRRAVRRSTIYVAALPPACVRTSINGATVWQCGGTYYQPSGGRYVVIYVN
ncbi:MAG: hypothetical protein E5Y88_30625 [Mesorhizobium sp.]|nr:MULTISPECIES: hypothetical protein [unclassified Mesorhizobium]AZO69465.1 hypothetical protein EJ075_15365 [Mesorhizobium sp. M6A.T.Cr.TU.016.01.1.1]RWP41908.1 MAG: hypothetical protein EOR05_30505 [Mesorhizobium sp.]RWQ81513.1 MAG: hypothetical protein EOS85_14480 [Mesorhizobium sp.]TIL21917.1 MAG: hypothetical protein E5Y88_30625 [Mesorhizobium sp.]